MTDRDFKGVWIPKEIWLDKRLNMLEKGILTEIDSLDNENGCSAGNEYLADFCQCSETKVSTAIKKLIDLDYIYLQSFNGRTRILKSRVSKFEKQSLNNLKAEFKNFKENNTSNNNTNNNTSNIKENKKESQQDIINSYNFSQNINEIISDWLTYKKEKGQTYKSIGLTKMLNSIKKGIREFGEQTVIDSINKAMESNYAGFFIKGKTYQKPQPHQHLVIDHEQLDKDYAKFVGTYIGGDE